MNCQKSAIVLLGPPGTGKTTLAGMMSLQSGVTAVETGELLRREVRKNTSIGKKLRGYMDSGSLAPSELVHEVVAGEIQRIRDPFIFFDGFPRRMEEIDPFFQMGHQHGYHLTAVLILTLTDELVVKRLTGRRICAGCGAIFNVHFNRPEHPGICDDCGGRLEQREDDKFGPVHQRLKAFKRRTLPVVDFFEEYYSDMTHEKSADLEVSQLRDWALSLLHDLGLTKEEICPTR